MVYCLEMNMESVYYEKSTHNGHSPNSSQTIDLAFCIPEFYHFYPSPKVSRTYITLQTKTYAPMVRVYSSIKKLFCFCWFCVVYIVIKAK